MSQTLEAVFDGKVIRPDEPIALEPNTRVRVVIANRNIVLSTLKPPR